MKQNYTYREIAHSWGLTSDEDIFFISSAFFNWATANKVNIDYIFDNGIHTVVGQGHVATFASSISLEPEDLSKIEDYAFSTSLASRQRKLTIAELCAKTGAKFSEKVRIWDVVSLLNEAGTTAQGSIQEDGSICVFLSTIELEKMKQFVKNKEIQEPTKEYTVEDLKFRRCSFNENAWKDNLRKWVFYDLNLPCNLSEVLDRHTVKATQKQFDELRDHIYKSGLMIPGAEELVHWVTGDSSEAMQLYFETRRKEIYGDLVPPHRVDTPLQMRPTITLLKLRASWNPNNGFNQFIRKHLMSDSTVLAASGLVESLPYFANGYVLKRLFKGAGVEFVCKGHATWVSQCDIEKIKLRLAKAGESLKPQSSEFSEQHAGETVELNAQFDKVEKLLEQELKDNRQLTNEVNGLRAALHEAVSDKNRVEQEFDRLHKKYQDSCVGNVRINLVPEKSEDVKALAEELEQTKKDLAASRKVERDFQSKCDIGDTKNKKLAEELTKANNKLKRISEYLK